MPIDNDLLYGTRAIANYLELPVQKCRDLINFSGIPTFTMPGSTTRCARKSSLNANWQKYEQAAPARCGGVTWMQIPPSRPGGSNRGNAGVGGARLGEPRGVAPPRSPM